MAASLNLGVQSYTFRAFTTMEALAKAVNELGLSHVEIWPGHLAYDAAEEEREKAFEILKSAGLTMQGYGAVNFSGEPDRDRPLFEFARAAGVRSLTVVDVERGLIPGMEKLCDEYEVNIALHNHGTKMRWGTADSIAGVFASSSPRIGLCLDTAWCIDAGEEPLEWLDRFGDRLYGVHLKDFSYDNGERRDVIVGTGGLDLAGFLTTLHRINFDGFLSMEYEGDVNDPLPSARECVQVIKNAVSSVTAA